ncbi:MAG: hypothetical protein IPL53_09630 [Ignavibacteria bacterium]|nr:hypothetical protein [Ignavibacteria bacterium]
MYNILWEKIAYLPSATSTNPNHNLEKYPVYIFHHLMKCGGTSMTNILYKWFRTINDKLDDEDLNTFILKKYDVNNFHNDTCLISHFQREGIYLHQRYPESLERSKEFRIFIVMRNPLS